jgi:hypothetical protein
LASHEDLHVTLTLLIGVALTCGVLYWSGRNAGLAPAVEPVAATSPPTPLPPAPVSPLNLEPVAPQPEPVRDPPASRVQAQETSPANYDGPDLPIVFAFSARSIYTTEEDTDGNLSNVSKRVTEGVISNSSGKPLTITATEVNIATQETSQTQFVLSPGTQKHFGLDQGLKMISGDQMTLRSPTYKDFVQQVP